MPHTLNGKKIGDIGFGLMSLTIPPNSIPDEEKIATMKAALDAGCNYWDGGTFYGPPDNNSLTLLNKYFAKYPEDAERVYLNVKGCAVDFAPAGSPEQVRESVEAAVGQLGGVGRIDLFEPARKDPKVPIEDTVKALAGLVAEGKIGGVGLSEVSAQTIRRAAKVAKIEAVETELSMWHTGPLTNGVAEACAELGIPLIAYSPLSKGFLSGGIRSPDDLPENDYRRLMPRFSPENFDVNLKLSDAVKQLAAAKGCTMSQIAISWVVALGRRPGMPVIIPIPGTKMAERVRENARLIELSDKELAEIDDLLASLPTAGERYPPNLMKLLDE